VAARIAAGLGHRMDFAVEYEPEIVHVNCSGAYSLAHTVSAFEEAFLAADRDPRNAILIDTRAVTGPGPSTADRYEIGLLLARLSASQRWRSRAAILMSAELVDPDRIGEVVARNRMANVRVFTSHAEALAWLHQAPAPPSSAA